MSTVRFSVVVPTRERADTLRAALRTCLDQGFDDYEVLVSDNCSSPATRAVVDELASPKLRYVRTPEPLSMSANWDFAVARARGEYVTVLGDDDGLLPHALCQLDGLLQRHPAKAVRWSLALYTWPTFLLKGHEDYLRLPLGNAVTELDGFDVIRQVAGALERYEDLPMVYNAAVRRDVLDELRGRVGKVFPHYIPDIYSGFAVAGVVGKFVSTTLPLAIRGLSGSSNGSAQLFAPGRTRVEAEFHALNARDGLHSESRVPALPALPAYSADTLLFAKRMLFPNLDVPLDRKRMVRDSLACIRVAEADWPAALATARRSLTDDPELLAWFDAELAGAPYRAAPVTYMKPAQLGFDGTALHLDTSAFGVTDVAGAAQLCARILNCPRGAFLPPEGAAAVAQRIKEIAAPFGAEGLEMVQRALGWYSVVDQVRSLKEQNAALRTACDERAAIISRMDSQVRGLSQQLGAERKWSLKRPLRVLRKALGRGAGL